METAPVYTHYVQAVRTRLKLSHNSRHREFRAFHIGKIAGITAGYKLLSFATIAVRQKPHCDGVVWRHHLIHQQ